MIRMEVTAANITDLAAAAQYERDGAILRRDLVRALRAAVRPAVTEAKASIMSMPSGGLRQPGGGLRAAIARQVTTEVSATRRSAKVKVKVRKRNMPRGFRNAPRAVNSPAGWRHPVLGSGGTRWVSQLGKPGWFDEPLRSHRVAYQRAVRQAMDATADRIARRT